MLNNNNLVILIFFCKKKKIYKINDFFKILFKISNINRLFSIKFFNKKFIFIFQLHCGVGIL